ncbi:hypothetical protein [Alistipes sp.]|uniref:hypothetical protein n=1 Tax=Alistipes sp. TaxID=1872444 RepID=UPI003AF087FB
MNSHFLIIGLSFVPAAASILLTLPLWRMRRLRNQTIQLFGLVILLLTIIGGLIPIFRAEESSTGFVAIAVSSINIFIFRHYERLLNTIRCPFCRRNTLRLRSLRGTCYELYCHHCGLHSRWHR